MPQKRRISASLCITTCKHQWAPNSTGPLLRQAARRPLGRTVGVTTQVDRCPCLEHHNDACDREGLGRTGMDPAVGPMRQWVAQGTLIAAAVRLGVRVSCREAGGRSQTALLDLVRLFVILRAEIEYDKTHEDINEGGRCLSLRNPTDALVAARGTNTERLGMSGIEAAQNDAVQSIIVLERQRAGLAGSGSPSFMRAGGLFGYAKIAETKSPHKAGSPASQNGKAEEAGRANRWMGTFKTGCFFAPLFVSSEKELVLPAISDLGTRAGTNHQRLCVDPVKDFWSSARIWGLHCLRVSAKSPDHPDFTERRNAQVLHLPVLLLGGIQLPGTCEDKIGSDWEACWLCSLSEAIHETNKTWRWEVVSSSYSAHCRIPGGEDGVVCEELEGKYEMRATSLDQGFHALTLSLLLGIHGQTMGDDCGRG
ncbi:hypothetical protein B0T10DRAFT_459923 [Thelonectria olida]|uniref:Uncharacterized protein n=1 Tax=Thelonectria olida TaxID=1576542 RepID=A0A9P8W4N3_9HYPO|nr:hypothetical protein B0T10DRAFT_459923 [Thelonectria olida]